MCSVTRPGLYGFHERFHELDLPHDLAGRRREMGLGSCVTVDQDLAREQACANQSGPVPLGCFDFK